MELSWRAIGSYRWCRVGTAPRVAHVTLPLHKCFQVQFKILVITFKALNGMDPDYWAHAMRMRWFRDHLILIGLAHPTVLKEGTYYRVCQSKLAGSRKSLLCPFLAPWGEMAPTHLTFHKNLKSFFCQTAWIPRGELHTGAVWLRVNPISPPHTHPVLLLHPSPSCVNDFIMLVLWFYWVCLYLMILIFFIL